MPEASKHILRSAAPAPGPRGAIAAIRRLGRNVWRAYAGRMRAERGSIVVWASDFERVGGEGVLAHLFVSALRSQFGDRRVIVVSPYAIHVMRGGNTIHTRAINPFGLPEVTSSHQDKRQTFFTKYIIPLAGACFIRSLARQRRTVYLNYLPLWNFPLLLLIPRSTVLGPVVGGYPPEISLRGVLTNPAGLVRGALMPACYMLGALLIARKFPRLVLGNPCTYTFFPQPYRANILLTCVNILAAQGVVTPDQPDHPTYDVFFYLRAHSTRHPEESKQLMEELCRRGYKVCAAGEVSNVPGVVDKGYVPHETLLGLLVDSSCFVCLSDNIFAITAIEALALGVHCVLYSQPALITTATEDELAAKVFSKLTILPTLEVASCATIISQYLRSSPGRDVPIDLKPYAEALRRYLAQCLGH